jgi:hypothetical protein
MGIVLFKEITTEDYLTELETASERYTGLYVDMENIDERRYVKEKAELIKGLVKKVDRKRIDLARDYKKTVEAEAELVISRLEAANLPFTALIDEHTEARRIVLAEQKAIDDAKALVIEIANCHDEALMFNKVFAFERAEEIRVQQERDDVIRAEAAKEATVIAERQATFIAGKIESDRLAAVEKERLSKLARENDTNHKREVNRKIVSALALHNVDETLAKFIVTAIAKGEIPNLKINY